MSSRHSVAYTLILDVGLFVKKVRKNGHQSKHQGTPQNNLGTPLGVPTPTLGTTALSENTEQCPWRMKAPG